MWEWFKKLWAVISNIWLAKDLAVWVLGPTLCVALIAPLAVWAFTPASPVDLLLVMIVGGVTTFALTAIFAPRLHTHSATVQLAGVSATAAVGQLAPRSQQPFERDTSLGNALAYVVTGNFDRKAVWENESGAISAMGDALKQFEQYARDGKLHVWGKLDNWSVHDPIPAEYWSNHNVKFLDLFLEEANIEIGRSPLPHYKDLRVSKAEFETIWPQIEGRS